MTNLWDAYLDWRYDNRKDEGVFAFLWLTGLYLFVLQRLLADAVPQPRSPLLLSACGLILFGGVSIFELLDWIIYPIAQRRRERRPDFVERYKERRKRRDPEYRKLLEDRGE